MGLIIVSGLSGAGKSVAMHALEDLGYYCVDNLPVVLLDEFVNALGGTQKTAVSIDARNGLDALGELPDRIKELRETGAVREVLFLEAVDDILLNRFSETRRKHPLSGVDHTLAEALALERAMLEGIRGQADAVIDTTLINLHQLTDLVRRRIEDRVVGSAAMAVMFESFGFKHGIPATADLVFDARCLPNPYWEPRLRGLTGCDRDVATYLDGQAMANDYFEELVELLTKWIPRFEQDNRAYFTVAVGCTGGQHRSVYMVERLTAHFRTQRDEILSRHREQKGK
jgi:RNase adapter protein RapZ